MVKMIIQMKADENIPTDADIIHCIDYSVAHNCISRLEWIFPYSGKYIVDIYPNDTLETVRNKMPKIYGV